MTDLELLARQVGVNERTLRRAVSQGTLRAARPTPRTLDLSFTERRYVRRAWPLLSALRSALRTEQNVRFALLFGSAATGADTPASDVDVLVDLLDPSLDRVLDLAAKLTRIVGRRVDVMRLADAEAEPSMLADIVADGRVIVDRERLWPRLRRRPARLIRRAGGSQARRTQAALAGIDRLLGA
jgi:predicted nucleotidyltransferase